MSTPPNNKKIWTNNDLNKLKMLIRSNTPIDQIAKKLSRSIWSIYNKARENGLYKH